KTMPGFERYQKMSRAMTNAVKLGSLSVTWKDGGKAFEFQKEGKRYRYDVASLHASEISKEQAEKADAERARGDSRRERRGRSGGPAARRPYTSAVSPAGAFPGRYDDRNAWG